MFSKFLLKKVGIFILITFVFLIGTSEYSFANEEDILLKARKYYQQGNYDASVKVLQKFIENLRAIVEQKKNVAEAFYLLAKVYYTVGEDAEVDENLKKVYETFPSFSKEENDIEFKKRIVKVRKKMGLKEIVKKQSVKKVEQVKPVKKVIQKEGKKKKKFPILLVVGGVVVVALIALLLLKKKEEVIEEVYDIRGGWTVRLIIPADGYWFEEPLDGNYNFNFQGQIDKGTFTDSFTESIGLNGVYTVNARNVDFRYINLREGVIWRYDGHFSSTSEMNGNVIIEGDGYTATGEWRANRNMTGKKNTNQTANKYISLFNKLLFNN